MGINSLPSHLVDLLSGVGSCRLALFLCRVTIVVASDVYSLQSTFGLLGCHGYLAPFSLVSFLPSSSLFDILPSPFIHVWQFHVE